MYCRILPSAWRDGVIGVHAVDCKIILVFLAIALLGLRHNVLKRGKKATF